MVAQKLITFAVFFICISYLAASFSFSPTMITSNQQLVDLEDNTKVSIAGLSNSAYLSNNYYSFKINDVEVSSGKTSVKINSSVEIIGFKSSFLNKTWIEALKLKENDN